MMLKYTAMTSIFINYDLRVRDTLSQIIRIAARQPSCHYPFVERPFVLFIKNKYKKSNLIFFSVAVTSGRWRQCWEHQQVNKNVCYRMCYCVHENCAVSSSAYLSLTPQTSFITRLRSINAFWQSP